MKRVFSFFRSALALGAAGALTLALAVPVDAGSRKYSRSKHPYWAVGQYNEALSNACRRSVFNQKKIENLNIGYSRERGKGVTGIAMLGWNLRDPQGLAEPNVTYHFFNDGYSNCKVYVARMRPR